MFNYPHPKRHPLHTFQFWFIVLIGVGLVGAWQLGLIKAPQKSPQQLVNQEPMPPATDDELEDLTKIEKHLDPVTAPVQSEDSTQSDPTAGSWPNFQVTLPSPEEAGSPHPSPQGVVQISATSKGESWADHADHAHQSIPGEMQVNPAPPHNEPEMSSEPAKLSSFRFANEAATAKSINGLQNPEDSATRLVASAPEQFESQLTQAEKTVTTPADLKPSNSFSEVDALINAGDEVSAHRLLSTSFWQSAKPSIELMDRINRLASRIYFQPQPHYMDAYIVQNGDRLETIARQYQVSWEYLAKLNRTDPQRIRAEQALKVIQGPFSAVVDLSEFKIVIHAHGYYVTSFACGIGKDGTTPIGTFKVTDKLVDPTYYGPDGVVQCDDPSNPLGERWIAISDDAGQVQGYGIHGTIDPASIGKAESRGCIRLQDHDIENVYDLLTVGSEVVIRR